ncbi:MAG: GTP-binding protein [Micromonosporaceae bacterium]
MARRTLNLGILAHVDAGKTTLTERLLYAAGVIDEIGSVDAGTTQTDSLDLERQRGITIKAAVVSFVVGGVTVNLIDTPGHPDFIAEVERVLGVLDGAVLVISAVEGVQPQTRVLMRALQRLRVPTLIFVNKIDRGGADGDRVLANIERRLAVQPVPMGRVTGAGTRAARFRPADAADTAFRDALIEVLTARSDALLTAYVQDEASLTHRQLRHELAAQTKQALVHPVFFGSAITGEGVESLLGELVELLPTDAGDADAPVAATVFKVDRGPAGEKVAYLRMFAGTARTRDRLHRDPTPDGQASGLNGDDKVTAISVFHNGAWIRRSAVTAGEIGRVWGLGQVRVGDALGPPRAAAGAGQPGHPGPAAQFAPPTLETAVVADRREDRAALRVALARLAEQDPLINVRQDDARQEIYLSLYGEVQKEVIQATLAGEFGLAATFRESTTICVERPIGRGEAIERLHGEGNPFLATIGLRVEPAPIDSGVAFRLDLPARTVPAYVYKNVEHFAGSMGEYVRHTLKEGLFGWAVTDCLVTMIECNYSSADGPPSTRGPLSTAADFRKLTPLVLMRALARAGSVVCEPVLHLDLEVPSASVGPVLATLAGLGATVRTPAPQGDLATIVTLLPAARLSRLQRRLPGLTGGEGVLEPHFAGYRPVTGGPPVRPRTTPNPLHREEYLTSLSHPGAR